MPEGHGEERKIHKFIKTQNTRSGPGVALIGMVYYATGSLRQTTI